MKEVQNIRIVEAKELISPKKIKADLPTTEKANQVVFNAREEIKKILSGEDTRLLLVVGPCSIHDPKAALEYAARLQTYIEKYKKYLCIVMRVYFEKPRTTIGWKGLINDPHLNNSYDLPQGLHLARELLLKITEMGVPTATEMLDTIVPQYISDLVSWAAIGARTTESQPHREMASGLSMPVGFKNSTDGNLRVAMDALQSAMNPHHFIGINQEGMTSVLKTTGNPYCHIILRGGNERPNFDPVSIGEAVDQLKQSKLNTRLMVDCSHANSNKKHENQALVWKSVLEQRVSGNTNLMGMMLESHLHEGNQKITGDLSQLKYGVSITDACVSWELTEQLLESAYQSMEKIRK